MRRQWLTRRTSRAPNDRAVSREFVVGPHIDDVGHTGHIQHELLDHNDHVALHDVIVNDNRFDNVDCFLDDGGTSDDQHEHHDQPHDNECGVFGDVASG